MIKGDTITIDRMMTIATISALRAGRLMGVNDMGLLEDWEELLDALSEKSEVGKWKKNIKDISEKVGYFILQ